MPVDFTGNPAASVDLGAGPHSPQIRFAADESSCIWNEFPVYIYCCPFVTCPGLATFTSLADPTIILAPGGASSPSQWPPIYVPDALCNILSGFKLQIRVIGTFVTAGIFGNVRVTNEATGLCFSHAQAETDYDSDWQDCSPSCSQMAALGHEWLKLQPSLSNGSGGASWRFDNWQLLTRWVSTGAGAATYRPNQELFVGWEPPRCNPHPGLYVQLATDSCGVITTTYTQIRNAVNALGLGVTATVLGGHGADLAEPITCGLHSIPDPCSPFGFLTGCELDGAICSGTAGDTPGG